MHAAVLLTPSEPIEVVIPHLGEAIVAGALVLLVAIGVVVLVAARRRRNHRHAAR